MQPGTSAPLHRSWRRGDRVVLDLPVRARRTVPDEGLDSVRGCVAIERGPLVYCFEQLDQPDGAVLDDVVLESGPLEETPRSELLGGVVTVQAPARTRDGRPVTLTAVPNHTWANRTIGPMTVWIAGRS